MLLSVSCMTARPPLNFLADIKLCLWYLEGAMHTGLLYGLCTNNKKCTHNGEAGAVPVPLNEFPRNLMLRGIK
jgi:hypothetical protein